MATNRPQDATSSSVTIAAGDGQQTLGPNYGFGSGQGVCGLRGLLSQSCQDEAFQEIGPSIEVSEADLGRASRWAGGVPSFARMSTRLGRSTPSNESALGHILLSY